VLYPEVLLIGNSVFMKGPCARRQYRDCLRIGGVKLNLDAFQQMVAMCAGSLGGKASVSERFELRYEREHIMRYVYIALAACCSSSRISSR
jgi:hypothetical protein